MDLKAIVQREVEDYSGPSHKAVTYAVSDMARQIYTVVVVPDRPRPFKSRIVVMARVVGERVIIDEDTTDKPRVQALVRAGIPREKIVLLYGGEDLPEASR